MNILNQLYTVTQKLAITLAVTCDTVEDNIMAIPNMIFLCMNCKVPGRSVVASNI